MILRIASALRRRVVVLFEDVYPTLELYNQFERSTVLDLMRPVYLTRRQGRGCSRRS